MSKYNFNLRLEVIKEHEKGYGSSYLSKKYHIKQATIENWIFQYRNHGEEGLKKSMSKIKYSGEFKLSVIQYRQIYGLSYNETAAHFGIKNASTIANWQRSYEEQGADALFSTIGRPKKLGESKLKNNEAEKFKTMTESEKEELIRLREENMYLQAEILYLKKLRALIHKEELKTKKKRS